MNSIPAKFAVDENDVFTYTELTDAISRPSISGSQIKGQSEESKNFLGQKRSANMFLRNVDKMIDGGYYHGRKGEKFDETRDYAIKIVDEFDDYYDNMIRHEFNGKKVDKDVARAKFLEYRKHATKARLVQIVAQETKIASVKRITTGNSLKFEVPITLPFDPDLYSSNSLYMKAILLRGMYKDMEDLRYCTTTDNINAGTWETVPITNNSDDYGLIDFLDIREIVNVPSEFLNCMTVDGMQAHKDLGTDASVFESYNASSFDSDQRRFIPTSYVGPEFKLQYNTRGFSNTDISAIMVFMHEDVPYYAIWFVANATPWSMIVVEQDVIILNSIEKEWSIVIRDLITSLDAIVTIKQREDETETLGPYTAVGKNTQLKPRRKKFTSSTVYVQTAALNIRVKAGNVLQDDLILTKSLRGDNGPVCIFEIAVPIRDVLVRNTKFIDELLASKAATYERIIPQVFSFANLKSIVYLDLIGDIDIVGPTERAMVTRLQAEIKRMDSVYKCFKKLIGHMSKIHMNGMTSKQAKKLLMTSNELRSKLRYLNGSSLSVSRISMVSIGLLIRDLGSPHLKRFLDLDFGLMDLHLSNLPVGIIAKTKKNDDSYTLGWSWLAKAAVETIPTFIEFNPRGKLEDLSKIMVLIPVKDNSKATSEVQKLKAMEISTMKDRIREVLKKKKQMLMAEVTKEENELKILTNLDSTSILRQFNDTASHEAAIAKKTAVYYKLMNSIYALNKDEQDIDNLYTMADFMNAIPGMSSELSQFIFLAAGNTLTNPPTLQNTLPIRGTGGMMNQIQQANNNNYQTQQIQPNNNAVNRNITLQQPAMNVQQPIQNNPNINFSDPTTRELFNTLSNYQANQPTPTGIAVQPISLDAPHFLQNPPGNDNRSTISNAETTMTGAGRPEFDINMSIPNLLKQIPNLLINTKKKLNKKLITNNKDYLSRLKNLGLIFDPGMVVEMKNKGWPNTFAALPSSVRTMLYDTVGLFGFKDKGSKEQAKKRIEVLWDSSDIRHKLMESAQRHYDDHMASIIDVNPVYAKLASDFTSNAPVYA